MLNVTVEFYSITSLWNCTFRVRSSDSWIICVPNLQIGDEFDLGKGFVIKAFKTYHVVPSQVHTMQPRQDSNDHYKPFS